jgi:RHH-type transcriptional regulator, rel operon repressor / antitoxin RelB
MPGNTKTAMAESLTVRLDAKSKRRLDKLATATARSKSVLAADAIRAYLDLYEWQVNEIRAGLREADAGDFASHAQVKAALAKLKRHAL